MLTNAKSVSRRFLVNDLKMKSLSGYDAIEEVLKQTEDNINEMLERINLLCYL